MNITVFYEIPVRDEKAEKEVKEEVYFRRCVICESLVEKYDHRAEKICSPCYEEKSTIALTVLEIFKKSKDAIDEVAVHNSVRELESCGLFALASQILEEVRKITGVSFY